MKNKEILLDSDLNYKKKLVNVDLLNELFKRSNSVKANNKEFKFKIKNNLELNDEFEKNEQFKNKIFQMKINLIKFALSKNNLKEENYSNHKDEQNNIINTD